MQKKLLNKITKKRSNRWKFFSPASHAAQLSQRLDLTSHILLFISNGGGRVHGGQGGGAAVKRVRPLRQHGKADLAVHWAANYTCHTNIHTGMHGWPHTVQSSASAQSKKKMVLEMTRTHKHTGMIGWTHSPIKEKMLQDGKYRF